MAYSTKLRSGAIAVPKGMKWCSSCEQIKLLNEFANEKKNRDGRAYYCKECKRAKVKAYYKGNSEKVKSYQREYALAFPEKVAERHRQKVERNPEKYRQLGRKKMSSRRARLRGAFVECVDPQAVYERDEGVCGICGNFVEWDDFEVDHIQTLVEGGRHEYANVQCSHLVCNRTKGSNSNWQFDI